jgi:hypothetical protein
VAARLPSTLAFKEVQENPAELPLFRPPTVCVGKRPGSPDTWNL